MIKKILILIVVLLIVGVIYLLKFNSSAGKTAMKDKIKVLCDARTNCENGKKLPKGVCVPGGTCTSS